MWSGGNDVQVELNPGSVRVRSGRGDWIQRNGPELADPIPLLNETLVDSQATAYELRNSRLQVTLGSAYCPQFSFEVPAGIANWSELLAAARSAAASELKTRTDRVEIAVDPRDSSTIAVMPTVLKASLQDWAAKVGCTLVSIRPDSTDQDAVKRSHDFISDVRWAVVWLATACVAGAFLGTWGWKALRHQSDLESHSARLSHLSARLQRAEEARNPMLNSKRASAERAALHLQWDTNKAFAVLENVNIPQAKLLAASLDMDAQSLRIEYELAAFTAVPAMTTILNSGYEGERRPWKFEAASATSPAAQTYRATWTATLPQL